MTDTAIEFARPGELRTLVDSISISIELVVALDVPGTVHGARNHVLILEPGAPVGVFFWSARHVAQDSRIA